MIDKCVECGATNMTYVEYGGMSPEHYDGISEVVCNECSTRYDRWTGEKVPEGYIVKRFGGVIKTPLN